MSSIYEYEYTDTFGGEANYSWVKRGTVTMPDWDKFSDWNGRREPKGYKPMLMRKAKEAVGLTGVRGVSTTYGDTLEFRPFKRCAVLFITFKESTI